MNDEVLSRRELLEAGALAGAGAHAAGVPEAEAARRRRRRPVSRRADVVVIGAVTFRVERRGGPAWTLAKTFTRKRDAGSGAVTFNTRGVRAGRFRVVLRAQDSSRNRSKRAVRRFRVVR